MYIVDFTGAKIELEMDAVARQTIVDLLLAVRMEGGVGLVLPGGDSFRLEGHDWEEKEDADMQWNIEAGKPAKHNLTWSAKDYADLSERFRTDSSATIYSLAKEFQRSPSGIQGQLQKMKLMDQYGAPLDYNRIVRAPQKKHIHGTQSPEGVLKR